MSINWFPGHMTKASRQISEALKRVDLVIELRDARIVEASKNPLLATLGQNKPRLIVLSKRDLADPQVTAQWLQRLSDEGEIAIALDFYRDDLRIISEKCRLLLEKKIAKQQARGIKPRAIRALIVGIPNVGKSTLINRLLGRKSLTVADQPGITRALKLIKVSESLELLDSPGVLWPKLDDQKNAMLLAVSGAISDKVLDSQQVAEFAYRYLYENYPQLLFARYGDLPADFFSAMLLIGQRRHYYTKNQQVDEGRVLSSFIDEVRSSYFQGVSWQKI